ncbi:glycine-rich cell wall structural protein 1-like [Papaver somniferum]|uniref:glycine-rich cell wall structural protein 1-like n=1 Tax=Papaver somniferum TaxID=3469 RepID=UPI000E70046B|nr:glycine-rich cell wall structural protein 1-like [Papaver somniferum]
MTSPPAALNLEFEIAPFSLGLSAVSGAKVDEGPALSGVIGIEESGDKDGAADVGIVTGESAGVAAVAGTAAIAGTSAAGGDDLGAGDGGDETGATGVGGGVTADGAGEILRGGETTGGDEVGAFDGDGSGVTGDFACGGGAVVEDCGGGGVAVDECGGGGVVAGDGFGDDAGDCANAESNTHNANKIMKTDRFMMSY